MKNQETTSKLYYTERAFDELISYYERRIEYWYSQTGELPKEEINSYVGMFQDDKNNTEYIKELIIQAIRKGVI